MSDQGKPDQATPFPWTFIMSDGTIEAANGAYVASLPPVSRQRNGPLIVAAARTYHPEREESWKAMRAALTNAVVALPSAPARDDARAALALADRVEAGK